MKKLIQVLIVCGLFVVMGGTASGEFDLEKAKKLAESGDPDALYEMGEWYLPASDDCIASNKPMPEKCSKDAKSAIKWYTRGFEKGCAFCAADLAIMYQKGYGIKKNQIEEKNG